QLSLNVQPKIIFSESMLLNGGAALTSTIADTVIELLAFPANNPVAFTTQLNGDTIFVLPTALQHNTTYSLRIKDDRLSDQAGNLLAAGYQTSFTTAALQTVFQAGDLIPVAYRMNATGTEDAIAFLARVNI